MTNYEKYWIHGVIAIVGLVVGFVGGAYWKAWDNKQEYELPEVEDIATSTLNGISGTNTSNTNVQSSSEAVGAKTYSIYVPNQKAGNRVIVESISVKDPSWVVITEDDNGSPAWILGAQKFFPGTVTGSVGVLRDTVPGRRYHAIIYNDNGDNKFDFKVDGPITDNDSKSIESIFIVS